MPRSTMCRLSGCLDTNWATQSLVAFSGNTQNMSTWGNDAISTFGGMYIATNAQESASTVGYFNTPIEPGGRTFPIGNSRSPTPTSPAMGLPRTAGHSPRTFHRATSRPLG